MYTCSHNHYDTSYFLQVKLDSCVINGQFLRIVDIKALY